MQKSTSEKQISELIKSEIRFPSPPAIAVQILNAVQKDEASLAELGKIISSDPALTAQMLKVANSGLFFCSTDITNINRAMSVLGSNIIKNIALSFVIAAELGHKDQSGFDVDHFWRRSVTAAVSAELLAKKFQHKDDDIFVTALLQDIGMLVIAQTKKNEYNVLLQDAELSDADLIDLEMDKYGYNHQQVGSSLLLSWNLPHSISVPISYHHQPEKAQEPYQKSAQILHIADQLASIYNGTESAEKARLLQQQLVDDYDIDEAQALELLDTAATHSNAMIETFELDPSEIKPYSMLLQEANLELGNMNLSNEQLILELMDAKTKSDRLAHELQDKNSSLRELVYRDGLTGLYNHRYFHESLSNELSRATRYQSSVSLILLDIDLFKKVNDTHGHLAGDLVLMNIARAISSAVRPNDIISRFGGDEFAVILPETSSAGVKVFATRLRLCVEGIATLVDGQEIYVTVSTGVTTFGVEQPDVTKDLLIATADRGLYQSKEKGRNQITIL
jgi:diguanylate cyclase (GGDEF)-like protein